jgi:hypothetical protein
MTVHTIIGPALHMPTALRLPIDGYEGF